MRLPEELAIEEKDRLIIDPIKMQPGHLSAGHLRGLETPTIPPVLSTKRIRNGHIIKSYVRIRIYALFDQCGQDRSWYRGIVPSRSIVTFREQFTSTGKGHAGICQLPAFIHDVHPLPCCAQGLDSRLLRLTNGHIKRCLAFRQRGLRLRSHQSEVLPILRLHRRTEHQRR